MNPKILRLNSQTFPIEPIERGILSQINADIIEIEGQCDDEILPLAQECDAVMIVSAYLRRPVIDKLDNCKIISRAGTGYDKIDVAAATGKGIVVTNVRDVFTDEVADHTMALLLCAARLIRDNDIAMRKGIRPDSLKMVPRLFGQTIGIIGFGSIGRAVAKRAQAFGMCIIVNDPALLEKDAKKHGVELVDFNAILKRSDYLSLLCPLVPATNEMIKMEQLKQMKPGAALINTGRGELVRETDLAAALKTGVIRYAAMDVFCDINVFGKDGFKTEHPFFGLDNLLMTPHVAAISSQAMDEVFGQASQNIVDVLLGKRPPTVVNAEVYDKMEK